MDRRRDRDRHAGRVRAGAESSCRRSPVTPRFASNLAVILLFDLSFLLLGLMLFLVGRNLAKVIFEHRRGLMGSRLQARLVAGFIAVAIVPSAFLLYVSGAFLRADVDSWFNPEYERVLDDSLEIARAYYLNSANNAAHFARVLAKQISAGKLLAPDKRDAAQASDRAAAAGVQRRHDRGLLASIASCCCSRSVPGPPPESACRRSRNCWPPR